MPTLSSHIILFCMLSHSLLTFLFFFNDTATTEIYTLSLHDALPICRLPSPSSRRGISCPGRRGGGRSGFPKAPSGIDRKSTRLNSSHVKISYAVFCLKKKKKKNKIQQINNKKLRKCNNHRMNIVR